MSQNLPQKLYCICLSEHVLLFYIYQFYFKGEDSVITLLRKLIDNRKPEHLQLLQERDEEDEIEILLNRKRATYDDIIPFDNLFARLA